MTTRTALAAALTLLLSLAAAPARADEATLADIQKTLGQVPTFLRAYPPALLDSAWGDMKALQLNPATALSGKVKELIGLAVAAQVPCRYCVYFHTEAAKLNGATDAEVKEAVLMAAGTRRWSTIMNGNSLDEAQFRAELGKLVAGARAATAPPKIGGPVADAAAARREMQAAFGFVPSFFNLYPEVALAPAWKEFRDMQVVGKTALDGKTKELLGLAVAAQIPCRYCVVAHTEFARLNGATDAELREAVAMAAVTRSWSTYLNGTAVDEATFRRETDQIVARFKKALAKK
jgi:AhpD family alkylhydroperoxidase